MFFNQELYADFLSVFLFSFYYCLASIANERLESKLPILGSGKGEGLDI